MGGAWAEPPDWFKEKDYSYLNSLDASGWLRELERCAKLMSDVAARDRNEMGVRAKWDWLDPGWTDDAGFGFIGAPAVQVVDKADQASFSDLEKPARIIVVSLRATDHDILEGVKKILLDARRDSPGPARKPGPQALNAKFDKTIFARWIRYRIIQLCDLAEWRSRRDEKDRPKDADFGRWLFKGRDGSIDKLIFDAFKKLESAIGEIPALTLQVEREAEERRLERAQGKAQRIARRPHGPKSTLQ